MPKGDKKILKYNHEEKSLKVLFIIYIDTECLLKKQHSYPNNLQKSYTERKAKHEPSGWAVTVKCLFDATKANMIITEKEIVLKSCVKIKRSRNRNN